MEGQFHFLAGVRRVRLSDQFHIRIDYRVTRSVFLNLEVRVH